MDSYYAAERRCIRCALSDCGRGKFNSPLLPPGQRRVWVTASWMIASEEGKRERERDAQDSCEQNPFINTKSDRTGMGNNWANPNPPTACLQSAYNSLLCSYYCTCFVKYKNIQTNLQFYRISHGLLLGFFCFWHSWNAFLFTTVVKSAYLNHTVHSPAGSFSLLWELPGYRNTVELGTNVNIWIERQ